MALPSLQPRRLGRYRDLALILFKYGRSDLFSRAGLEEILAEDLPPSEPGAAAPEELARDLERLGPTFVKLGQVLSTRADLLPDPYLSALARLQDSVGPIPFARRREDTARGARRPHLEGVPGVRPGAAGGRLA